MFFAISSPAHKVLHASSAGSGVDNLLDHPFLGAVFCDDGSGSCRFAVREKRGVVGNVSFEEAGVEAGEGLGVVGQFEGVLGAFWECFGDEVRAVVSGHEFGDPAGAFVFVATSAVFGTEHDQIAFVVDIFRRTMFVGMVGLSNLGS